MGAVAAARGAGSALGIAVACLAVWLTHARILHPPRAVQAERFVPRPEVAKAAALGFHALVADGYWMQAVQVVGGSGGNPVRHAPLIARLIDVVTTLDPWVDHPYRFAANFLIDNEERVRFANRLLERGIAHHPDDWRNHFYLGFNHFFYLKDSAAAADALERAGALPGSPLYLKRLVARLRADSGGLETAQTLLEEMLRESPDEHAQAQFREALREVETERRARILDEAQARFREHAGRDLRSVDELVRGPHAVLAALPPEPNGRSWALDPRTGTIESTYYGHRYAPVSMSDEYRVGRIVELQP
jgi:hypothetical protein